MFFTAFKRPSVVPCPNGCRMQKKYGITFDPQGNRILSVVDEVDLYEVIQSFEAEANIHNILARCTRSGDFSPLNVSSGTYADVSGMPTNVHEVSERIKQLESFFFNLPSDQRSKFASFDDFKAMSPDAMASFVNGLFNSAQEVVNNEPAG